MSSKAIPVDADVEDARRVNRRAAAPKHPLVQVLATLASLRLTVFLFSISVWLVFCGTLAQDKEGIWDVVENYFRSAFVWIPFEVFFPRAWFGDYWAKVPGGFWWLGGQSIGLMLFINLLAAHSIRFRIQSKGTRLWSGLGVVGLGCVLAFMIIVNGNEKNGIQDDPIFSWGTLWGTMVVSTFITWLVMVVGLIRIPAKMFLERILLMLGLGLLTACLGWMLYWTTTGKRLDDSSLRILWQLIQGTIAGGIILVGCVLAFKKRAGMVLLHAGIGLMMLNELMVAQYSTEEQMTIAEGETVGFARDIRTMELSVIDRSDPDEDQVVVIPLDHLKQGNRIEHEYLPFDILIERYDRNSEINEKTRPDAQAAVNNYEGNDILVTDGLGQFFDIKPLAPIAGADASSKVDEAAAYVTILPKKADGESESNDAIATLLLSQRAYQNGLEETVKIDDREYFLGLRHKHVYKPYEISLKEVSRDLYVGTASPRGFASEFEIIDKKTGTRQSGDISMNDPLRYKGETFYQSGYHLDPSGIELSTLQIVTNDGWMIPYVSCMLVVVGMLAHFSLTLMRFLRRKDADAPMLFGGLVAFLAAGGTGVALWKETLERKRRSEEFEREKGQKLKQFETAAGKRKSRKRDKTVAEVSEPIAVESQVRSRVVLASALAVGLLMIFWTPKKYTPKYEDYDLVSVGNVPVVNEGRVLPFDSLSRNTLRFIRNRETFVDTDDNDQPAVKWMLDVMTGHPDAEEYQVFRITNLEVQSLLGVERRKRHVFSLKEINVNRDEFEERFVEARDTPAEERTRFQAAILDLKHKLNTYEALQRVYVLPPEIGGEIDTNDLLQRIDLSVFLAENIEQIPLGVTTSKPVENDELGWECFHVAATRQWLIRQANALDADNATDLANKLFDEVVPDPVGFLQERVQLMIFDEILFEIRMQDPGMSHADLERLALQQMASMTEAQRGEAMRRHLVEASAELRQVKMRFHDAIRTLIGESNFDDHSNPAVENWTEIIVAYQNEDPESFNAAVDSQLDYVETIDAKDHKQWKVSYETFYSRISPLFTSSILYVIAGVISVLAWIGWTRDLNRAAFWLLVITLLVHSFGLLSRMIISGRPPVTNLYSSAVFIGWGAVIICLVLETVFRIGLGNVLASFFGFVTLMIAYGLGMNDDTFKVLEAVLDTQFWLATHVVCITIGYTTTFVAGALGVAYVMAGIVSRTLDAEMRKMIARMLYGMVCFSIFFSFFGTVLGGLWADDSWGRFWGWDPKENGALMIVIWNAMLLHARWGGLVRERGMAVLAVGGNIVTTWSWFLVNQLGIGLHSYGFDKSVLFYSLLFCGSQAVVVAVGLLPTKWWASYRQSPSGRA